MNPDIKKPVDLESLTDEQKELAKEYAEENFKLEKESGGPAMNRSQRRNKLKWLHKQLIVHKRKKPKISHNPSEDIEESVLQSNISKMRGWATRYGIIIRKINELENHGTQENS